jgi:hypothetical protein
VFYIPEDLKVLKICMTIKQTKEEQESWESNLSKEIDQYIAKSNYSFEYKAIAMRMYYDILEFLKDNGSSFPFKDFLLDFRVKLPRFY